MDPHPVPETIANLNDNWTWLEGWIDAPVREEAARLARFKREIDVSSATLSHPALIRLSADTRYKLLINGTRVCVGPARGSDRFWFYDTVDFSPHLKEGRNVIEVIVLRFFPSVNCGEAFGRTCRPGLTVYGSIGDQDISTGRNDAGWKGAEDDSCFLPQNSEWDHFLNTYENITPRPALDFKSLVRHKLWNKQGVLSPWFLAPRSIPMAEETSCPFKAVRHAEGPMSVQDWEAFIRGSKPVQLDKGTKHRIELEFEVHSTAFLRLTADRPREAGATAKFTYSEAYEVLPRPVRGKGFTKKDDRTKREGHSLVGPSDAYTFMGQAEGRSQLESYEPFWWKTFRFIVLEIETRDEPLTLQALEFTQTNYPMGVVADWQESEETQKMWEISIRTMRNCMFDGYSDCPFYEQLQYGEDSRSAMLFHYLLTGDDKLGRQAITAFAASIQPDGLILARYPAHTKQIITGFCLFWVMEVCDHMLCFNEPAFAIRFIPVIDSIFAFFDRMTDRKTGLVSNLPTWFWSFIDWNQHWGFAPGFPDNGMPMEGRKMGTWSYFSMLYAFTLRRACTMLKQVGRTHKIEDYTRRAQTAVDGVRKHCWNGEFFTDSTADIHVDDNPLSQVSQIWGILSGALDPKSKDAQRIMLKAFEPKSAFAVASYPMQHYAFRALAATGLYDRFYDSMWDKWRIQIKKNLTTWEEDDVNGRSDCHEWSSLQIYEYTSEVVGLKPLEPGWETVGFSPRCALYPSVKAKVVLGHQGVAEVSWSVSGKEAQVGLKLPKALKVVVFPDSDREADHGKVDRLQIKVAI